MRRTFTLNDQHAFACLSGDYNPVHVDPIAARRLLFGRPVVHGIHALLWGLDELLSRATAPMRISRLKADFRGAILIDEPVELLETSVGTADISIDIIGNGNGTKLLAAKALCEPVAQMPPSCAANLLPPRTDCRERSPAELSTLGGMLPVMLHRASTDALFPNLMRLLPADQLATLLASTRLVGMEAPGLHSIYSGLDLAASDEVRAAELTYAAYDYDARFPRLPLRIAGPGLAGTISTLIRPGPARQASMADLHARIRPDEFRGERALVIGGSRGLGEVAVKALAAGGAEVRLTYRLGSDDARAVVNDIRGAGGLADCFQHDAIADAPTLGGQLGDWSPTVLCYFATPFIAAGAERRFSHARFLEFCQVYVDGFLRTFEAVRALGARFAM